LYVPGFELVGERKVKCCQSLLHCVTLYIVIMLILKVLRDCCDYTADDNCR
jgi:hypothetical protein